jgi:tetratricopeptide (TPR) repeat protein
MLLYERLGERLMTAEDFYLLGIVLRRVGKPELSIEIWRQGLRAEPDDPQLLYGLIQENVRTSRYFEAISQAERLARQPAWQAYAALLLGRIEYDRNHPAKAAEFWQGALKHEPDLTHPSITNLPRASTQMLRKDLARALLRTGRPAEARSHLQAILANGPDAESSWLLSRTFLQEGAVAEALGALKTASPFVDDNPVLADPAPFVGSACCAECHPDEFQMQQRSRHARTFQHVSKLRDFVPPRAALPDPVDARVTHTIRKRGDRLEQRTQTPVRAYEALVDYAFGSGDRGKTLVGHDPSGHMYELRMSVYLEGTRKPTWDITSGHPLHPAADEDFLGLPLGPDAVRRCFACHVTNPQAQFESPGPESADNSIGCEKCHGPAGNHLLAVKAQFPDLAIARPALASGASVVQICAQCHSPQGKPVVPEDPNSIRFQGTTLTWSRCYTESNNRLDCATCHNPHRNVSAATQRYEAKCLVCHGHSQAKNAGGPLERLRRFDLTNAPHATSCPINPATGCIACHMPSVNGAVPHSPFTDHFIRVHRELSPADSR